MANWRAWTTTTSTRRSPPSDPGSARCAASRTPRWPTCRPRPAFLGEPLSRLESGAGGRTWNSCCCWPGPRRDARRLVGAPPTGDPRIHLRPVTRHGMTMLPLTRRVGGIQAYKLVIPGSSRRNEPDPQTHEGYEWLYVLSGQLRVVLGEPTWCSRPAKRLSSTPASRLVRSRRRGARRARAASSARRASGRTCTRGARPGPQARSRRSQSFPRNSFQDLLPDAYRYIFELSSKAEELLGSPVRALPARQGSDAR